MTFVHRLRTRTRVCQPQDDHHPPHGYFTPTRLRIAAWYRRSGTSRAKSPGFELTCIAIGAYARSPAQGKALGSYRALASIQHPFRSGQSGADKQDDQDSAPRRTQLFFLLRGPLYWRYRASGFGTGRGGIHSELVLPIDRMAVGRGNAPFHCIRALRQIPEVREQEPAVIRTCPRVVLVHPVVVLIVHLDGIELSLYGLVEPELYLLGALG